MKYFSLFNGEEIHTTPGEKIVSGEDVTTLIEAADILKKIKNDGEKHLQKTKEECEELKKQACEEGFDQGLENFNTAVLQLEKEIKDLRDEFEKKIFPIALKAAKKILGEEIKLHPDRIKDIVIQALKPVSQHHKVKVYVNKADMDTLEKDKAEIKSILEQVETFAIQERLDVEPGGCIIETEAGIINAQLENQWRALEIAFKAFMNQ
jgi:type III secretion protein L